MRTDERIVNSPLSEGQIRNPGATGSGGRVAEAANLPEFRDVLGEGCQAVLVCRAAAWRRPAFEWAGGGGVGGRVARAQRYLRKLRSTVFSTGIFSCMKPLATNQAIWSARLSRLGRPSRAW